MKKIDKLILGSFVPPFVLTFFIALFVLIMQFLWKYIDDIVGKGLETHYILELIFFRSMALLPTAFPVAILISSVMVMGNLSERFELTTLKAAGVPLLRIMASLILFCALVSVASFQSANKLIPYSNLKFKSLLYDIRKQKPTLSLIEKGFNDDFGGTVIRIGEKDKKDQSLKNILIYDHSENRGNVSQLIARKGEMFMDSSQRFLVLKMYDGSQYQEIKPGNRDKADNYEHVQISFKEWEKAFDLQEFNLKETDESLFKSHQSMLSIGQLEESLDSLNSRKVTRIDQMRRHVKPYYHLERGKPDSADALVHLIVSDSVKLNVPPNFEENVASNHLAMYYQKAQTLARNVKNYTQSAKDELPRIEESIAKHRIEIYRKYSWSMACFFFLFIGAPMGAIVRKGGFGWPLLFSIAFFVFYIMFSIAGEKMVENLVVSPLIGMWLPNIVIFPLGVFLTYKAMNDSKILNVDTYIAVFKRLGSFLQGS